MKSMICFITWNRLEYTKRSLESIIQNTNRDDFDLLLWDNGSDKETVDWVRDFCLKHNFLYMFFEKNLGLTTAMNNQMLIADQIQKYDVFCHIANDIIVPKNWLMGVFEAIKTEKVGAVGINLEFTEFEKVFVDGVELEKIKKEGNLCGAHFCIPRWVWEILGKSFRSVALGYGQQDKNESDRIRYIPEKFLPNGKLDVYYLPLEKFRGEDLGGTGKTYDEYQKQIEHKLRSTGSDHTGGRQYRSWIDLNYGYYLLKKITAEQMLEVLKDTKFEKFDKKFLKETNIEERFLV
jgi:glycosyltransferase involved in cell wall biosynthesis